MAATHLINVDLAKVFRTRERKGLLNVLTWGAAVEVIRLASSSSSTPAASSTTES